MVRFARTMHMDCLGPDPYGPEARRSTPALLDRLSAEDRIDAQVGTLVKTGEPIQAIITMAARARRGAGPAPAELAGLIGGDAGGAGCSDGDHQAGRRS